ncbi:unnamed protein product [Larinioides sclopetarius]|uniref:Uncharacterized protein n=1 Tax=Larinioides sclopetarius TaxID=280406 RepID=A0AAV2AF92_9ARAC
MLRDPTRPGHSLDSGLVDIGHRRGSLLAACSRRSTSNDFLFAYPLQAKRMTFSGVQESQQMRVRYLINNVTFTSEPQMRRYKHPQDHLHLKETRLPIKCKSSMRMSIIGDFHWLEYGKDNCCGEVWRSLNGNQKISQDVSITNFLLKWRLKKAAVISLACNYMLFRPGKKYAVGSVRSRATCEIGPRGVDARV